MLCALTLLDADWCDPVMPEFIYLFLNYSGAQRRLGEAVLGHNVCLHRFRLEESRYLSLSLSSFSLYCTPDP